MYDSEKALTSVVTVIILVQSCFPTSSMYTGRPNLSTCDAAL